MGETSIMICKDCKPRLVTAGIPGFSLNEVELCPLHESVTEDKAERRRYALLNAAATIYAEGASRDDITYCLNRAEQLLDEIEKREKEGQS